MKGDGISRASNIFATVEGADSTGGPHAKSPKRRARMGRSGGERCVCALTHAVPAFRLGRQQCAQRSRNGGTHVGDARVGAWTGAPGMRAAGTRRGGPARGRGRADEGSEREMRSRDGCSAEKKTLYVKPPLTFHGPPSRFRVMLTRYGYSCVRLVVHPSTACC